MEIPRSTFYDTPAMPADDTALVEAMHIIKDEFEAYGWRRMHVALRQQGWIVNHKKIKRLMREHGLQPPLRRRFVATTDSDHDQPIFPDCTRQLTVDGADQLWVADLTYIAVLVGFVYVAVIMDAWSRRIVGYAIGRRIDALLTLAALNSAVSMAASISRLHPSFRSRIAVCSGDGVGTACRERLHRFHGPARQPL
jgi:putative transposase